MNAITDLRDTIIPKSDQLNADDLHGGPITITVTGVSRGAADQPVAIKYPGGEGRPYKPCKTMRKVLVHAWGKNGEEWVGKSMRLFCEPTVKFGGEEVGGIRISHLSHIEKDFALSVNQTRGKKAKVSIKRMQAPNQSDPPPPPAPNTQQAQPQDESTQSEQPVLISADQAIALEDALKSKMLTTAQLCSAASRALDAKVEKISRLPADFYQRAMDWIEAH